MNLLLRSLALAFLLAVHPLRAAQKAEEAESENIPSGLQVQQHIVYNHSLNRKGEPVTLLFVSPTKQVFSKAPLLIFIHGGGWNKGNEMSVFRGRNVDMLRRLGESGCAIASVEYRLAVEGKSTMQECAEDCWDAMRFFAREADRFGIDPQRVGLWGESAGAHLVLTMALGQSADYPGDPALKDYVPALKCVASYYAPTNFLDPAMGARWRDNSALLFGGTPEEKKEIIAKLSPAELVHAGAPPMLLVQGLEDPLVNFEHARYLKKKAEEKGVSVELIEVKGAGHGFKGEHPDPSVEVILEKTGDFFLKNLLPAATH